MNTLEIMIRTYKCLNSQEAQCCCHVKAIIQNIGETEWYVTVLHADCTQASRMGYSYNHLRYIFHFNDSILWCTATHPWSILHSQFWSLVPVQLVVTCYQKTSQPVSVMGNSIFLSKTSSTQFSHFEFFWWLIAGHIWFDFIFFDVILCWYFEDLLHYHLVLLGDLLPSPVFLQQTSSCGFLITELVFISTAWSCL